MERSKTYLHYVAPIHLSSFFWLSDFLFGQIPPKNGTSEAILFALMLNQPTRKTVDNHDWKVNTYCQNAINNAMILTPF